MKRFFSASRAAGVSLLRQVRGPLQALVPDLDLIAHSPLRRARETAALLAEVFAVPMCETAVLAPGGLDRLASWLADQPDAVALVVSGRARVEGRKVLVG